MKVLKLRAKVLERSLRKTRRIADERELEDVWHKIETSWYQQKKLQEKRKSLNREEELRQQWQKAWLAVENALDKVWI